MKKLDFKSFFLLCAYVLGSIGGLGNALYNKSYLIAVAIVILAIMAFPKAKEFWDKMQKGQE